MDISGPKGLRLAGLVFAGIAATQFVLDAASRRPGSGPGRLLYEAAAVAGGVALLVVGFTWLHEKRAIENVPKSLIRSVAMGFAELSGAVRVRTPQVAPLSGTLCAFYKYLVEQEERGSRGGTHWKVVDQGTSTEWFYLDDPTGAIVVDPDGVEAQLERDYRKVERDTGLFSTRKRYSEWRLDPGQPAYIVGTVRKLRNLTQEHQATLTDRLRELKHDPARLQAFDANHDGRIDTEEWGNAVRVVQSEVLKEEVAAKPGPPEDDLIIAKGDAEKTFIISDKGERAIVRALAWKSGLALAGGATLAIAGTLMLLARAGVVAPAFLVR